MSTEKLTPPPPAPAQSDDAEEKLAAFKAAAVWLYEEMSANPTLKPMSNVTDAQRTDARKAVAGVVQRLLTEDCRSQASAALKNEGGGVAMRSFWGIAQDSMSSGLSLSDSVSPVSAVLSFATAQMSPATQLAIGRCCLPSGEVMAPSRSSSS